MKKFLFVVSLIFILHDLRNNGCQLRLQDIRLIPEAHLLCASFTLHNFPFCHDPEYKMPMNSTCVDQDHVFFPGSKNITLGVMDQEHEELNVTLSIGDVCHDRGKLSWKWNQIYMCGVYPTGKSTHTVSDIQSVTFLGGDDDIHCSVSLPQTSVHQTRILHSNVCTEQTLCNESKCLPTCASLMVGDGGAYVCGQSYPSLLPSSVQVRVTTPSAFALPYSNTVCFSVQVRMAKDVEYVQMFEWQQDISLSVWGTRQASDNFTLHVNTPNGHCTSFTGQRVQNGEEMTICATSSDNGMWEKRMKARLNKNDQQLVVVSQVVGLESHVQEMVKIQDAGLMDLTMVTDTWDACHGYCYGNCQVSCDAALRGKGLVKCKNGWTMETQQWQGMMTLDRLQQGFKNMLRTRKMKDVYFFNFF